MTEEARAAHEGDSAEERDFQAASAMLLDPPPSQQKFQLLLLTLIGFAVATYAQGAAQSVLELAMLVGVLFVHELGHVAGMRLFGYRDVRMFFIPFFGAAASGRKRGVARWKEGVVLLAGPLPGIVIGCVLASVGGPPIVRTLAMQLIGLNAVNLLPIAPLDGGQLFQVTLFSRHRHLEIIFLGVAAAAAILIGIPTSIMFAIVGGLMLT